MSDPKAGPGTARRSTHRRLWNTGRGRTAPAESGPPGTQGPLVTRRLCLWLRPHEDQGRGREEAALPDTDACCRDSFSLPL